MFGVVLWSDTQEQKAVIWCEDHGDLAYYREAGGEGHVPLDAGDWVQFDMTTDRHMRFAHNPRLLAEGVYCGLAETLVAAEQPNRPSGRGVSTSKAGAAHGSSDPEGRQAMRKSADIVAFPRPGKKRRNKTAAAHLA